MFPFLQYSRTLTSALRTFVYGVVTGLFAINPDQAVPLVDGIFIGAVLADFVTWFIRSLILLPSQIWHGLYDTAINLFFAWIIYHYFSSNFKLDTETYSIACLAFLLVAGIKTAYYSLNLIEKMFLSDDE